MQLATDSFLKEVLTAELSELSTLYNILLTSDSLATLHTDPVDPLPDSDPHAGDRILCLLPVHVRDRITTILWARHNRTTWTPEEVLHVIRQTEGPNV